YQTDLAMSFNGLGMAELRLQRSEEAEAAFRRSLELYEKQLEKFPADAVVQSQLAVVHNNLGMALEHADQLEAAAASFSSAVEHQGAACQRARELIRCRDLLARHYANLGRVLKKLGRADEGSALALEQSTPEQNASVSHLTRRQP